MHSPESVLKAWMDAVNCGDLASVVALYDESAILIPTFSNRLLRSPEAIKDYFVLLAKREELSLALHDKTLSIQSVGGSIYSMSGIYCWRFAIDGELFSFEARFSYMINVAAQAPIIHHHSSQIPRML